MTLAMDRVWITRRRIWSDGEAKHITRKEWRDFVESDADLVPDGSDCVRWLRAEAGIGAFLAWRNGNIEIRNVPQQLRARLLEIATLFDATVQGEDGARYDGTNWPASPPPRSLNDRASEILEIFSVTGRNSGLFLALALLGLLALAIAALLLAFAINRF